MDNMTLSSFPALGAPFAPMDLESLHEFEDDEREFDDMPASFANTSSRMGFAAVNGALGKEKNVRRRSSKACDQCRKSKCKCERTADDERCRSCVMLGTTCTFLGPSRKRGPPKGYIDAIESRLHQTEAILGIILAASESDNRAKTLIEDLVNGDDLAREIIDRVDRGTYGRRGRRGGAEASNNTRGRMVGLGQDMESSLYSTHPSNEWQDHVAARLRASALSRSLEPTNRPNLYTPHPSSPPDVSTDRQRQRRRVTEDPERQSSEGRSSLSPARSNLHNRTLRDRASGASLGTSVTGGKYSPTWAQSARSSQILHGPNGSPDPNLRRSPTSTPDLRQGENTDNTEHMSSAEEDGDLASAVGQLSLNEDAQVRYHGTVSGLHLLLSASSNAGPKGISLEGKDGRNEGGIWRFPKARVWPPVAPSSPDKPSPPSLSNQTVSNSSNHTSYPGPAIELPGLEEQERLLNLYFVYVHPYLPIVHKEEFWKAWRGRSPVEDGQSPASVSVGDYPSRANTSSPQPHIGDTNTINTSSSTSGSPPPPNTQNRGGIPTLLLLSMFAIAARYTSYSSSRKPYMWTAGDNYLFSAKTLLDRSYASSKPTTCQALLLMAYREIGIGAMAQSWLYVGMAVRMAQDLGLHRSSEKWTVTLPANQADSTSSDNAPAPVPLFTEVEQQIRRRIWHACVVMDKYVSAYIGRPLSIFESDYDACLPRVNEIEEEEVWMSVQERAEDIEHEDDSDEEDRKPVTTRRTGYTPVAGRVISCFNASATLSSVLANIVQAIYAVRPTLSRHSQALHLERKLDRWYMELPEWLRYDPGITTTKKPVPPPHVLTLHMQYWCAVLLLHRPFIRHSQRHRQHSSTMQPDSPSDNELLAASQKALDLCESAALHITSIVSVFCEHFCIKRSSVFLCYYVFTASITHVSSIASSPGDPQAHVGLTKCMDVLKKMEKVWPSAGRAWELLEGARSGLVTKQQTLQQEDWGKSGDMVDKRARKRSAGDSFGLQEEFGYLDPTYTTSGSLLDYPAAISSTSSVAASTPPTESLPYVPSYERYDRWAGEPPLNFPLGLSTSVLPQSFSTGYHDSGTTPMSFTGVSSSRGISSGPNIPTPVPGRSGMGTGVSYSSGLGGGGQLPTGSGRQLPSLEPHGRYPQFWNDYAVNLGQPSSMLGSVYGLGIMGSGSPATTNATTNPTPQQQQQQQQGSSGMYLGGGFGGLFNNLQQQ